MARTADVARTAFKSQSRWPPPGLGNSSLFASLCDAKRELLPRRWHESGLLVPVEDIGIIWLGSKLNPVVDSLDVDEIDSRLISKCVFRRGISERSI